MKEIKNKILDCLANENFNQELIGDKVKLQNKINKLQKLIDVINVLQPLEDEFVLPEKWCIRVTEENIEFCKNLDNYELGFNKGYPYTLNSFYSSNEDDYGYKGSPELRDRIEITFDQLKKYVLNKKCSPT